MTAESLDAEGVVARLVRARAAERSGLAFDADGTLWAGDVGEDVFEWSTSQGLIRADAEEGLSRAAATFTVPRGETPSDSARILYDGYRNGRVPEASMCEIMTWCYAGYSISELREVAREAFRVRALLGRRRANLDPVHRYAEREGLRVIVVSASPRVIVEEGLRACGIRVWDFAGAVPVVEGAVVRPAMAEPLTYGAVKAVVGKRLLEEHDWLGSFGDNVFDIDMLRAARVAVAVHPKPVLRERLAELSNAVVLE